MLVKIFITLLVFSSFGYSQNTSQKNQAKFDRGRKIVEEARKASGFTDPVSSYKSFYIKTKVTSSFHKPSEKVTKEIRLKYPDKMHSVYTSIRPKRESRVISGWNEGKYRKVIDSVDDGKRSVSDITEGQPYKILKLIHGEKEAKKKLIENRNEIKHFFFNILSVEVLPLIFSHMLEKNINFEYLGTVSKGGINADVVGFKSTTTGRSYQLFFDSKSRHLILQKENFRISNATHERSYYFSKRKTFDNILIPTEIKLEFKVTRVGKKKPLVSNNYIDVLEFKVNPDFDQKIFQIEKKSKNVKKP